MFKKILLFTLIFSLVFPLIFTYKAQAAERVSLTLEYDGKSHAYQNEKITLKVNDTILNNLPMQPIILDDRTYVPAREVFEALGAVVDWKAETKQIYIGYGDTLIILEINKPTININGKTSQLSVAPKIINNKTMIPARFAAEALGFFVHWEPKTRVVSVVEPASATQSPTIPTTPTTPSFNGNDSGLAKDISSADIREERHSLTKITNIIVPTNANSYVYTIVASSEISKVDKILLGDNRFILDIYNAEMALPNKNYDFNNSYLKSIRVAQNQVAPEMITRVVFDITAAINFSASISGDRKSIIVKFGDNNVIDYPPVVDNPPVIDTPPVIDNPPVTDYTNLIDFSFASDGTTDKITIRGTIAPVASPFPVTNPDRLVIDLPSSMLANYREQSVHGVFSTKLLSVQFNANTARIVVDLRQPVSYSVETQGNETTVTIGEQSFQGVRYDNGTRTIMLGKSNMNEMVASSIIHTDDYLNLKYNFRLPGEYGSGTYPIYDGYINNFTISSMNGMTNISVDETRILAYTVTEDNDYIYIKAMLPKQKYSKIVIIDPGHGGPKPGTSGNGLIEKDINLDIALKLLRLIEADGTVKAYSTRLGDNDVELSDRAAFANNLGDIFVSIHNNAMDNNPITNGTETWYYAHSNDATVGISCQAMGNIFQKNMLAFLGTFDRKVKTNTFVVLTETTIPAILVEVSFVTNPDDAANLARDEYRNRAASALLTSIKQTFEVYRPRR